MKTKVTILGTESKESKKLKPIEFVKWIDTDPNDLGLNTPSFEPKEHEHIELVCLGTLDYYDIMFAYNESRSSGCIYLGHFNDGVVE